MDLYQRCMELYQTMEDEKARIDEEGADTSFLSYLSFHSGPKTCAVETRFVYKVLRDFQVTPVPNTPPYFLGVTNYKGTIITVLDGVGFFEFEEVPYGFQRCLVIFSVSDPGDEKDSTGPGSDEDGEWLFGIRVHSLEDLVPVSPDSVQGGTGNSDSSSHPFISGTFEHNGESISVIDLEKIIRSGALLV